MAVIAAIVLAGCTGGSLPTPGRLSALPSGPVSSRPNIVFVLTDDLSLDLVQYMPHIVALENAGMSFRNYTVTDSLCCPSRASIFTGKFPHDTGIFNNGGTDGGFSLFHSRGEEADTFATALQSVGYRTGFMGKYLNGYRPNQRIYAGTTTPPGAAQNWVPPGWSTWDAAGNGYAEYNYSLNENHNVVSYGSRPSDYMPNVLQGLGANFIGSSVADRKPFLLEISTFAPHAPFAPAHQDLNTFPGQGVPHGPAFDRLPRHAPNWLAGRPPLTAEEIADLDRTYRRRVEAVQGVDRLVGSLEKTLARTGQADNTYFVFSSDNGFHTGQYGLTMGKLTAFDTDIRVPLIVSGPGIPPGSVNSDVIENVDLAPTFESIAGAVVPSSVDGRSFLPLLANSHPRWRTFALVEHHHGVAVTPDPDFQDPRAGNPPSYQAIRSPRFTYVRYRGGDREYYNRVRDPYELNNIAASLSKRHLAKLDRIMAALHHCHGQRSCWRAGLPPNARTPLRSPASGGPRPQPTGHPRTGGP